MEKTSHSLTIALSIPPLADFESYLFSFAIDTPCHSLKEDKTFKQYAIIGRRGLSCEEIIFSSNSLSGYCIVPQYSSTMDTLNDLTPSFIILVKFEKTILSNHAFQFKNGEFNLFDGSRVRWYSIRPKMVIDQVFLIQRSIFPLIKHNYPSVTSYHGLKRLNLFPTIITNTTTTTSAPPTNANSFTSTTSTTKGTTTAIISNNTLPPTKKIQITTTNSIGSNMTTSTPVKEKTISSRRILVSKNGTVQSIINNNNRIPLVISKENRTHYTNDRDFTNNLNTSSSSSISSSGRKYGPSSLNHHDNMSETNHLMNTTTNNNNNNNSNHQINKNHFLNVLHDLNGLSWNINNNNDYDSNDINNSNSTCEE